MYSATFTFTKGDYDEEFYALDGQIAEIAKAIPGYLGEEAWENPATGLISNVYYWETMEALQQLIRHPSHVMAKQRQSIWLNGYQIVIAQVIKAYGERWYRLWYFFLHWSALMGDQGTGFTYQVTMHKNHDKFNRTVSTRKT